MPGKDGASPQGHLNHPFGAPVESGGVSGRKQNVNPEHVDCLGTVADFSAGQHGGESD